MSIEIIFVLLLLILAFILFSTEYVSFDVAAIIIMVLLLVSGILSPSEGLAGFSNPATVTVAAMFVLSEGLRRTGLLNSIGQLFINRMNENYWKGLFQMLIFVSLCSAFINNTAVVVIFIPIVIHIANEIDVSPSKLLMPLSFAGIFGGICTLIGTSTNILVSSIAEEQGVGTFSMFEFTPMGLILLAAGFLYLFIYGIRAIPDRRKHKELTKGYKMQEYLTDVTIKEGSELIDQAFYPEELTKKIDLDVIRIFKADSNASVQRTEVYIEAGDVLRIRGSADEIDKLLKDDSFALQPPHEWIDADLTEGRDALVEAAVAPESSLSGRSLDSINFYDRFGAVPLAVRQHGELQQEKLGDLKLEGGSSLLLSMNKDRIQEVDRAPSFVVASKIGEMRYRPNKTYFVLAIMFGVIATAALNIMPIVVSAAAGAVLMILTGCLNTEEAYQAVNWKVIMLLAGVIPLGTAMNKTGAAALMADQMIFLLSDLGPRAVLSGFFLLTMGITAIMSNNASAALLAPIAIKTANTLEVNAFPFLFAVTFAASLSFITPFGYQTNTLIYGAGEYKFTDFTKIGLPLNIFFWILATIFIPMIWPF
jgi:di/tricarboxylate transporter